MLSTAGQKLNKGEPNKSLKRTAPTGAASHYRAGCGALRSFAAPAARLALR